ncbi:MAG: hypothetical protein ACE5RJ_04225, partial [Nitrosopumilaceae archaeon]
MILSKLFLQIEETFGIGDGLEIAIGVFSIVLFALAITAYRNTKIKKILFAAAAFGLFAVQLLVDSLEDYVEFLEEQYIDIFVPLITLAILILFFV